MVEYTSIKDELHKPLVSIDEEDLKPLKKQAASVPRAASSRSRSSSSCFPNCLSSCCMCTVITLVLFFALSTITCMAIYSSISNVVQDLTVSEPLPKFPIVEMTDEQLLVVKDRIMLFVDQLRAGVNPNDLDDLVITQDEINGFIGHSDCLRGNAYVTLEEGAIYEEHSIPTDMLPGGAGRYFVGHGYAKTQVEDQIELNMETAALHHDWFDGPLLFAQLKYMVNEKDMLELYLEKGSFFGHEETQEFIDLNNLLEDNEDALAVLDGIEYVNVHPGMIVIHPGK